MAGQSSIRVDAGTGSPVDFSVTTSAGNYRQAVTIGDPLTDANYASVGAQGLNVVGTMSISNSPTVILGAGSNVVGTFSIAGTPTVVLGAGSNIVGTFTSVPSGVQNILGTITAIQSALPAGSNIVGTFTAISSPESNSVYLGTTATAPQFGTISFVGLGNNVVVGTIASKAIRVLSMNFTNGTATNIYFVDSAGKSLWGSSTAPGQFAANSGIVFSSSPWGIFQTGTGNALIANISATSSIAGSLTYIQV